MQLAHVSPSGLRGGDHAFALTRPDSDLQWLARSFVEASERAGMRTIAEGGCQVTLRNAPPIVRRVVEILNDQPGIELRIDDDPILEAV